MASMNVGHKKLRVILALVFVAVATVVVGVLLYVACLPAVIG
jgi:hypothetical protein